MTRTRRLATTALLSLLTASLSLVAGASPASAASPVTGPDSASMYAGNYVELNVLANDTDADGDELAVCRVAPSPYKKVDFEWGDSGDVFVFTQPSARPRTYTFTYYACDFETLVPGTLTVTVVPEPDIRAKALTGQPGRIKVTNPADFKIRFLYGSFKLEEPDGVVRIPRNSSIVLTVRRTKIDWIALSRKGDFLRQGHVRGIKLPPGTTPPAAGRHVSPRVARLWQQG